MKIGLGGSFACAHDRQVQAVAFSLLIWGAAVLARNASHRVLSPDGAVDVYGSDGAPDFQRGTRLEKLRAILIDANQMRKSLSFPRSVEIKRVIAAAQKAGLKIASVEIYERKITIKVSDTAGAASPQISAFDQWKNSTRKQ